MKTETLKAQLRRTLRRELWMTLGPALLLVGAAFVGTFYFIKPAPPKTIVIATPQDEGGFRYYARRYTEFLAKHGVTLGQRVDAAAQRGDALRVSPSIEPCRSPIRRQRNQGRPSSRHQGRRQRR